MARIELLESSHVASRIGQHQRLVGGFRDVVHFNKRKPWATIRIATLAGDQWPSGRLQSV